MYIAGNKHYLLNIEIIFRFYTQNAISYIV